MGGGVPTAHADTVIPNPTPPKTVVTVTPEQQACNAVVMAEQTKWLSDLNYAKGQVGLLKASSYKDYLTARVNTLASRIYGEISIATSAIIQAESTKAPSDIYNAKKLTAVVQDPGTRSKLDYRLSLLEPVLLSYARADVAKVEQSRLDNDMGIARIVVGYLNPSFDKDSLTARLDAVQKKMDAVKKATDLVVQLEQTYNPALVAPAKVAVAQVDLSAVRDDLNKRIQTVEYQMSLENKANGLVTQLEQTFDPALLSPAKAIVSQVSRPAVRDALNQRIQAVEYQMSLEKRANDLVSRLEATFDSSLVAPAKVAVSQVGRPAVRDALNQRIQAVESQLSLQDRASSLVARASQVRTVASVKDAYGLCLQLKNQPFRDSLVNRLKAIQTVDGPNPLNQKYYAL